MYGTRLTWQKWVGAKKKSCGKTDLKQYSTSITELKSYMYFRLTVLKLAFTENGWLQSSVIQHFWNWILHNLWSEPPLELQNNLTWIIVKMLCTKNWEKSLHPWMLTVETEAVNVHIVDPHEEPEVVKSRQTGRNEPVDMSGRACILHKSVLFCFFFISWWIISSNCYAHIV